MNSIRVSDDCWQKIEQRFEIVQINTSQNEECSLFCIAGEQSIEQKISTCWLLSQLYQTNDVLIFTEPSTSICSPILNEASEVLTILYQARAIKNSGVQQQKLFQRLQKCFPIPLVGFLDAALEQLDIPRSYTEQQEIIDFVLHKYLSFLEKRINDANLIYILQQNQKILHALQSKSEKSNIFVIASKKYFDLILTEKTATRPRENNWVTQVLETDVKFLQESLKNRKIVFLQRKNVHSRMQLTEASVPTRMLAKL